MDDTTGKPGLVTQSQMRLLQSQAGVMDSIREEEASIQRREVAALKGQLAHRPASFPSSGSDSEYRAKFEECLSDIAERNARIDSLEEALRKKNSLILEWMHANAAFKKLARKFSARLGVEQAERDVAYNECILEAAGEDPAFAKTELGKKALAFLKR